MSSQKILRAIWNWPQLNVCSNSQTYDLPLIFCNCSLLQSRHQSNGYKDCFSLQRHQSTIFYENAQMLLK